MLRVIVVALATVLGAGCASEGISRQQEASCCLGSNGDVLGEPGCAGSCVVADADGSATLALPWCSLTHCGRKCAPLEDSGTDYLGCVRACRDARVHIP